VHREQSLPSQSSLVGVQFHFLFYSLFFFSLVAFLLQITAVVENAVSGDTMESVLFICVCVCDVKRVNG